MGGMVQWLNLLDRPLFSCLHEYYDFTKLEEARKPRIVSGPVLSILMLNLSLFMRWTADMTRPWWPFLPASGASPAFGVWNVCGEMRPCTREISILAFGGRLDCSSPSTSAR